MISSVDKSTINMVLNNAKTKETRKTEDSDVINMSEDASAQTAQNLDTLELSTDAQTYLDTINSESEETASAETTAAESSSDDSTDELYTYTESELAKMLALGEITQSEYDQEMASRNIVTE